MRYRKESKVEVVRFKDAPPYGAWRLAEIISGNGHTYSVRYYTSNNETLEERVSRKMIRPCPPVIDVERWEAGEVVEVCNNTSWKTATVVEELHVRYYVVRLLGTTTKLTVHKNNLRVRQSWQDERWVVTRKVSCSVKQNLKIKIKVNNKRVPEETKATSLKNLKRRSPCDWFESAESCTQTPKKIRSMYKEGPKGCKIRSGSHQMVRVRSKGCSQSAFSNDCNDNDASSVGSCSIISYNENGSRQDSDACSSDAESSKEAFGCREESMQNHSLAAGTGEVVRSFRTELYTYRKALWEVFASGSINWDQQASLADLRSSLNISNYEHMMELRYLKSAGIMSKTC